MVAFFGVFLFVIGNETTCCLYKQSQLHLQAWRGDVFTAEHSLKSYIILPLLYYENNTFGLRISHKNPLQ